MNEDLQKMNIPQQLVADLPTGLRSDVETWWGSLTDEARRTLTCQWEPEADECRFSLYFREDESEWRKLSFEALAEEEEEADDWEQKRDFFEYAVNHELLFKDHQGRTTHVCRAHKAARQLIKEGKIPANFVCPVNDQACPMREIVKMAGGKSVRFLGTSSCSTSVGA